MRGSLTRTERSIVAPRTVTHRVALLALILMLGAPRAARATSCVEDALERSFRNADAVFLGVIESSRPSFRHPLTMTVNRVRVLRAWKGVTEDRVNLTWVESDRWMGDKVFWDAVRGIPFSGSDTLVVAAWWHEGALATGFCTFTLARYGGHRRRRPCSAPGRCRPPEPPWFTSASGGRGPRSSARSCSRPRACCASGGRHAAAIRADPIPARRRGHD